ncbi:MAG TPA: putative glycoside hydrolase [Longimicrobiales bacterium]
MKFSILVLIAFSAAAATSACSNDSGNAQTASADSAQQRVAADTTAQLANVAAAPGKSPAVLRGIYLNAYAAGSKTRLAKLLAIADSTEINAFVIDVKDEKGMRYRTQLPLQKQIGGEIAIGNLKAVVDSVKAHGVWTIARIVVFKDPMLSQAKPQWSIKNPAGQLWRDKQGNSWVSTWDPNVWEYNIQIAEDVLRAGFDEVQFDYVRFPEPFPSLPKQIHEHEKGDRTSAIEQFLDKARPRVKALGGVMAADLFGLSPNDPKDVQIGQQWERILAKADHVLPMTYPSHYLPTHLKGITRPNQMPYETVFASVGMGVIRAQRLRESGAPVARVIPWLQAFSAPWVTKNYPYGVEQAEAQVRAVYDVGLEDWIFWHPGSKYEHIQGAFQKEEVSRAKKFDPPANLVAQVNLLEKMGAKAERDKVAKN